MSTTAKEVADYLRAPVDPPNAVAALVLAKKTNLGIAKLIEQNEVIIDLLRNLQR